MEAPTTSAQLYCLCRSFDRSQFMIACHHCGVQYHGRCVGVTEQAARFILQYACPPCRDKDPTLNVIYKMPDSDQCPQPGDDEETVEMQESTDGEDNRSLMDPFTVGWFHNYAHFFEWTTADQRGSGVEAVSEENAEEIDMAEDVEKTLPFRSKSSVTSDKQRGDRQDSVFIIVSDDTSEPKLKRKRRRHSCMECSACAITEDCGVCSSCRDMPKFGGSGNLRQKCVKRRCLRLKRTRHVPYVSKRVSKKKTKKKKKKLSKDKTKFGGHNIIRQKCVSRRCADYTSTHNSCCKTISKKALKKTEIIRSIDALIWKDSGRKQRGTRRKKKGTKLEQSGIEPKQSGINPKSGIEPKQSGINPKSGIEPKQSGINPKSGINRKQSGIDLKQGTFNLKESGMKTKQSGYSLRRRIKKKLKALRAGCQQCEPSNRPDCRKCVHCLDRKKYGGKGLWRAKCKIRRCSATCPTILLRKELRKQLMEVAKMIKNKCQRESCEHFPVGRSRYCSKSCEIRVSTRNTIGFLRRRIKSLRANCEDERILVELKLLQGEVAAVSNRIGAIGKRINELWHIVDSVRQAKENVQGGDQENLMDCPGSVTVLRESELACFMNERRKNAESINVIGRTWGAENIMKKADAACCCPLVPNLFDTTSNYCPVPQSECREHQGWETLLKAEVELQRLGGCLQVHRMLEKLEDLKVMMS